MLHDIEDLLVIEKRIDTVEDDAAELARESIRDRWESGRWMLAQRKGKQLPKGAMAELVEATGKSSSELNYRVQFAERYSTEAEVSSAMETFTSWTQVKSSLPKPSKTKPRTEPKIAKSRDPELLNAIREAVAADQYKRQELAQEFNVHNSIMDLAHNYVLGERDAAPIDWKSAPGTYADRYEREVVKIRRKLELEAQARVTAEVQRIFERTRAEYEQLKARTDRILDSHKGVFTKAEFSVIQACLHPDNSASTEKRAQAFDLFRAAQDVLVGEKDQPTKRIELPSLDELKRRRASKQ